MTQENRYHVYYVKEVGKEKKAWIQVGAAFQNQDGKGFNIVLDALPLNFDGRLVLRESDRTDVGPGPLEG